MDTQISEQILTVKEAIESRQSIRKFTEEEIPRETLQAIFNLVRLSPSAWNLQPWRFHVVTDSQLKEKLQEAAYGQQQVTSAPAVVLVTSDMEDVVANLPDTVHPGLPPERKEEEVANLASFFGGMSIEERGQWGLTQAGIALGFLLITIQGLGYASVPMLGFDQEKVKEILGLPEHVKFAALVPMGRAASEGYPHHRHKLEKIVSFH
ncbi:Nitroreductase [Bacillus sp. OV322]|uniref:nitroreductase family protein n=1 Tax=Bacillus sp. OV322 TaxID=1882764 RepID=UPI0008E3B95E|nr:nitroreductase family protein [Bacillus sp. OV322]SFC39824.1 Nitroreductase [Bacillus sp. OV322]